MKVAKSLIEKATDPKMSLNRRISIGSPHPEQVKNAVKKNGTTLVEGHVELNKKKKALENALENLQTIAAKLSK